MTIDISNISEIPFRLSSVSQTAYTLNLTRLNSNYTHVISLVNAIDKTPNYMVFNADLSDLKEGSYKYELINELNVLDSGLIYLINVTDNKIYLGDKTKENEYF